MKRMRLACLSIVCALVVATLPACASRSIEEPDFTVVEDGEAFEIRDYAPRLAAETRVSGDQRDAGNAGFRILADYIFGNNVGKQEIAMTAPVSQAPESVSIAMTAPVAQTRDRDDWVVRFFLPQRYTLDSAPEPVNDAVTLRVLPAERVAARRFSGYARQGRVDAQREALRRDLDERGIEPQGPITLAQYDPPWTLWFLRRNEVMVPIAR